MIFEGKESPLEKVEHTIKTSFEVSWKTPSPKVVRIQKELSINKDRVGDFFDGDCKGAPCICRDGAFLYLAKNSLFTLKFGARLRTKNGVKLFSLWILLKIVANKGLSSLQDMGDSKFLMDWASGHCKIQNLVLLLILKKVLEVKSVFFKSPFHVFSERPTTKLTYSLKKPFLYRTINYLRRSIKVNSWSQKLFFLFINLFHDVLMPLVLF